MRNYADRINGRQGLLIILHLFLKGEGNIQAAILIHQSFYS